MQLELIFTLINRSMKKSLLAVASVTLFLAVLLGSAPAIAQEKDNTGTLQYEGKSFPISIGEIGKDDKGNTTVGISTDLVIQTGEKGDFSNDFSNALSIAFSTAETVIKVKIVAKNKTVKTSSLEAPAGGMSLSISGGGFTATFKALLFSFDTTAQPEKIIVYNDQGSVTFDGKTKRRIK